MSNKKSPLERVGFFYVESLFDFVLMAQSQPVTKSKLRSSIEPLLSFFRIEELTRRNYIFIDEREAYRKTHLSQLTMAC